ncbi:MAG: hypothetical protein HRJ53_14275 [Acidobacteria bacterium Pan2503]|uniref:Uncharacterized protein n=1 Tax=Candidatus Acidiferrum panamense TaxID=2741543 RepID=A0A7V8NRJ5_9BACT|nr:hypothetical protein [Candidatus Acidoferrum panamensis]
MPIRQEKLQVSIPVYDDENGEQWVFPSERYESDIDPTAGDHKGVYHKWLNRNTAFGEVDQAMPLPGDRLARLNIIPPTEIREPCHEESGFPLSRRAGESDVSGYIARAEALRDGFTHCPMVATDDQYTGQHADLFYGTPIGKNDAGDVYESFAERNNYLDRE